MVERCPKDVHAPSLGPGTWDCVTSRSKRDFHRCDEIKDAEMTGLSRWAQRNHKVSFKKEAGGPESDQEKW